MLRNEKRETKIIIEWTSREQQRKKEGQEQMKKAERKRK
jgi:hypothetical protein